MSPVMDEIYVFINNFNLVKTKLIMFKYMTNSITLMYDLMTIIG